MADAGIRLSIGTDSHALVDGFEETRAIELDSRLATERRGSSPPPTCSPRPRPAMESLGWDAGRLEPGRPADFVAVRMDSPRTAGADLSLAATAVFAATAADVDTVVIGGRIVVEGGHHALIEDVAGELATAIGAIW